MGNTAAIISGKSKPNNTEYPNLGHNLEKVDSFLPGRDGFY